MFYKKDSLKIGLPLRLEDKKLFHEPMEGKLNFMEKNTPLGTENIWKKLIPTPVLRIFESFRISKERVRSSFFWQKSLFIIYLISLLISKMH